MFRTLYNLFFNEDTQNVEVANEATNFYGKAPENTFDLGKYFETTSQGTPIERYDKVKRYLVDTFLTGHEITAIQFDRYHPVKRALNNLKRSSKHEAIDDLTSGILPKDQRFALEGLFNKQAGDMAFVPFGGLLFLRTMQKEMKYLLNYKDLNISQEDRNDLLEAKASIENILNANITAQNAKFQRLDIKRNLWGK